MKKILISVLVLALSIGMASIAFAGNNSTTTDSATNSSTGKWAGRQNCPQLKLSDEQKAQMTSIVKQKLELQKQIIQDNVTNGTITAEQAKVMTERINTQLKAIESGEFTPGMGGCEMRKNGMRGNGKRGGGMHGNRMNNGQCPLAQEPATN